MMKVLMFGWEFPPVISGGLGIACHGIVQGMTKQGVQVNFVLPHIQNKQQYFDNLNLISASEIAVTTTRNDLTQSLGEETVRFLNIDTLLHPYCGESQYNDLIRKTGVEQPHASGEVAIGKLKFSGRYGPDLLSEVSRFAIVAGELARNVDFDVIHAHDWMSFPAACEVKAKTGKPLICHVHATEYDRAGYNPSARIAAIEKHGMEKADVVIAVSERAKNVIIRNYGISGDKIKVVYNAIDREQLLANFSLPDPRSIKLMPKPRKPFPRIALFLGRVTLQKGPEYFVEAARLILKQRDDIHFVIAGDGDLLPQLILEVVANHMHSHVHFTGFLNRDEVAMMYHMSDVYVMPSVSEPFGISAYEAIFFELPTIVSHQSGVTEVLKNVNKIDFWDVHGIANKIMELIDNPDMARQQAQAGARELEAKNWDLAVRKILRIYRELLEK